MYQALYRKYRPNCFEDVVGQDVIVRTLQNSIAQHKTTHAYLFTGPRGTGKTSIAKIFAKTINCVDLQDGKPCNKCVSCTQINDKQTTDIVEIDAASNNGVDEIRELKSKVNLVPSNSKYKVYIIDEVHMLTVGAFNALLKTLEEPPAHIIFILATTEPHKIPATILSRCQRFDFKKISDNKIAERLAYICQQEKINIESPAIQEIARLSDGGLRDAISMLDQVIAYTDDIITPKDVHDVNGTLTQLDLQSFVKYILKEDIHSILNKIDEYNNQGKNLVKLTEEIILFFRNLLLYLTIPEYLEENQMAVEIYQELSPMTNKKEVLKIINQLNDTWGKMRYSHNPKMLLEILMIQLFTDKPVEKEKSESISTKEIKHQETVMENKVDVLENKDVVKKTEKKKEEVSKNYVPGNSINSKTVSNDILEKLNLIRKIRINNTLASFNKNLLRQLRTKVSNLHSLILEVEYAEIVTLLLDGEIKAASDDYVVLVYPTESNAILFNENLIAIEKLLESQFNHYYHLIATNQDDWEEIKTEFNSKTKKYTYQEEPIDIYSLLEPKKEDEQDDMQKLFGDIVEYN